MLGGQAVIEPYKHVENSAGKSHLLKGHTYFPPCTIYLYPIVGISKENSQLASAPPCSLFTPGRRNPPYGLMGGPVLEVERLGVSIGRGIGRQL